MMMRKEHLVEVWSDHFSHCTAASLILCCVIIQREILVTPKLDVTEPLVSNIWEL